VFYFSENIQNILFLVQMAHTNEVEFPIITLCVCSVCVCTIAEQLAVLLQLLLLRMLRNLILSANISSISFHMLLLKEKT